jgi:hypothetical protein
VSAWPLMCLVSELPPAARFNVDNMILAGIWCGRSKPIIDVFVKQFVDEIQKLSSEGITVTLGNGEMVSWKVQVLQLVADLPAKAQLLNQIQYNGTHGCSVRSVDTLCYLVLCVGMFYFIEVSSSRRENCKYPSTCLSICMLSLEN